MPAYTWAPEEARNRFENDYSTAGQTAARVRHTAPELICLCKWLINGPVYPALVPCFRFECPPRFSVFPRAFARSAVLPFAAVCDRRLKKYTYTVAVPPLRTSATDRNPFQTSCLLLFSPEFRKIRERVKKKKKLKTPSAYGFANCNDPLEALKLQPTRNPRSLLDIIYTEEQYNSILLLLKYANKYTIKCAV